MKRTIKFNFTEGEKKVLRKIAESDFRSDDDLAAPVWQVTESNEDKGYQTSLIKKGLVGVDNVNKGEETCWLTKEGIEAYKQLLLYKEVREEEQLMCTGICDGKGGEGMKCGCGEGRSIFTEDHARAIDEWLMLTLIPAVDELMSIDDNLEENEAEARRRAAIQYIINDLQNELK